MKPVKYELFWDEEYRQGVYIEQRRSWDVIRWAIVGYAGVLGKTPNRDGMFRIKLEPLPSSRDEKFLNEYRWESVEDANQFWLDNRPRILATSREYREFAMRGEGGVLK